MSSEAEKLEAIKHATDIARKEVEKLELIKSCSKLNKTDEYRLLMAKDCVRRGELILRNGKTDEQ